MKRGGTLRNAGILACTCAGLCLGLSAPVFAADAPPEVSPEGLHLVKSTDTRLVYVRPGASLAPYKRYWIVDCFVEFEKDWQKDYNSSRVGLEGRVSDKDVERIKRDLAAEFKKVFTEELTGKGGYELVNAAAPDVLVLRPALINVEVNAPDLMSAGVGATVVRSAGQMTLYLELWDAATNTLLARVLDARADRDSLAQVSNSVTNKAAADRILRTWARQLRENLDAVKTVTPGQ